MIKKILTLAISLFCANTYAMDSLPSEKTVITNAAYCIVKNAFKNQVVSNIIPRNGTVTYYESDGKELCTYPSTSFYQYKTDRNKKPTAHYFKEFLFEQAQINLHVTVLYDAHKYQLCSYTSAKEDTLEDVADACSVSLAETVTVAKEKTLVNTPLHEGVHITYRS